MQMTIFTADCVGNAANCSYPNKAEVKCPKDMETAVARNHVCATYTNNYRNEQNFLESDVIPMDIDNDHSEDPKDWITEEKMKEMFGSIDFILVPSRHHMVAKDGKPARPKYHVYFPVSAIKDAETYKKFKALLQKVYPFFDANALNAARFLFGATVDESEVVWNEGWMSIIDDIEDAPEEDDEDFDGDTISGTITQGNRNNTLSRFAGRVLKRYGETDKAHEIFLDQAKKCDPPLDDSELSTIWFSAVKFFRNKIAGSGGYVPPDQFNNDFGNAPGSLKPEDYSDIGQAKVLAATYGDELKFTAATDFLRFTGQVWEEDKQLAVGACVEFLDLQLQDAKDYLEVAKKALIDKGYPEGDVNKGSKAIADDIQPDDLPQFYMLVGAEKYLGFAMKRRDYKYITSALNVAKSMLASEMQEGVRLNTSMVKQLCSTDEIQACKKYKAPFHFVPSHQVVLYTNHLPKVGANDDGIWRRLKVIPFNAKITGSGDIKNYADYLYEKAAPAIMKWIIEGAEKVTKSDHKVDDPKCVSDAVAAYREENDWLWHFLEDCCDVDPSYEEKSGEFYQQYRAYCI